MRSTLQPQNSACQGGRGVCVRGGSGMEAGGSMGTLVELMLKHCVPTLNSFVNRGFLNKKFYKGSALNIL